MMKKRRGSEILLFVFTSSFLLYTALRSILFSFSVGTSSVIGQAATSLSVPNGFFSNCVFVLKIVSWASFEEMLYRVYFPNKLECFFLTSYAKVFSFLAFPLFIFLLPHALFALAHSYLGVLAVLFAFFASILLRSIYILFKDKIGKLLSFILICSIHSIYNICVLYLILPTSTDLQVSFLTYFSNQC